MSTFDLVPELAARLDSLVPAEGLIGDWDDVLQRLERKRERRNVTFRLAIAVALFLLIVGVAAATYLIVQEHDATPKPGAVSFAVNGVTGRPTIVKVLPGGRTAVVWRCPRSFCGEITSFDWAPDGRHLAATFDAISMQSAYLGLHIIDLGTGHDVGFQPGINRPDHCLPGVRPAWSPDGRQLAFACSTGIYTMTSRGTDIRRIPTGDLRPGWPTWSPDGRRVAFAAYTPTSNSIYVSRLDGSRRIRVASNGEKPDWSPDGKTIAYRAADGIRFVTPAGLDVTPVGADGARTSLRPRGIPSWSLDGSTVAISTLRGVYVLPAAGGSATRVTHVNGSQGFGLIGVSWHPEPGTSDSAREAPANPRCEEC
jgi:dipeptidyl aminopeptidase/acylaminoacyl peptidase